MSAADRSKRPEAPGGQVVRPDPVGGSAPLADIPPARSLGWTMSATASPPATEGPTRLTAPTTPSSRTLRERTAAIVSSAVAAILGVAPHVLHHAGPLAGAALLAGTAGTLLFGVIGLIAAIPFLLRVHRRCGNWRVPAVLLATFAAMFSLSAFVIGPAITNSGSDNAKPTPTQPAAPGAPAKTGHDAHH